MSGVRKITTDQAIVRTAAVEIKTLTISGKQMTMGVFRQLQIEPIIDDMTAQLRGVPWGIVNYYPKPCDPDHLHVVWQIGNELRRACVYASPRTKEGWYARRHIVQKELEVEVAYRVLNEGYRAADKSRSAGSISVQVRGENYSLELPASVVDLYWFRPQFDDPMRTEDWYVANADMERRRHDRLVSEVRSYVERRGGSPESWGKVEAAVENLMAFKQQYENVYAGLASLDQLFIAV